MVGQGYADPLIEVFIISSSGQVQMATYCLLDRVTNMKVLASSAGLCDQGSMTQIFAKLFQKEVLFHTFNNYFLIV